MMLKQEMYYGAIVGHKRQGIGVGCKHTVSVPKEEQFIVEGRHEGIITKEDFLKAQEIFYEIGETKNVIQKTYPLYQHLPALRKTQLLLAYSHLLHVPIIDLVYLYNLLKNKYFP
jgi:hypothetical protein